MKRALLLCGVLLLLLGGCQRPWQRFQREIYDVLDTYTRFTAYARTSDEFHRYSEAVYEELLRLHRLFDIYNDYEGINNIKTINDNAGIRPVEVDPDIIELLEDCLLARRVSGGAVDVSMGPVLRLWHECREAALADPGNTDLPGIRELADARERSRITGLVIDAEAGTVFLREAGMSLDVGAVAKGYAAQKAVDQAVEAGLTSGILSAGGNICVVGAPADGRDAWSVGIQSPEPGEEIQGIYDTLSVTGPMAVVTSGDYQRYFEKDGVLYHHIIDPATSYPAWIQPVYSSTWTPRKLKSVTVLHPDSTMADILSTAAFILPREEALAMLEEQGADALWIWEDGGTDTTEGYRAVSQNFDTD